VVEHFLENVQPLLAGHAKAMVVVGSRVEAVRWKLAVDDYVKAKGYQLGTLVAFSGEVNDPHAMPVPVTETSTALNPGLKGRDIRDAFATDEFQILLVANKFQTGFDQPLLCGMYVDKPLAGIQAVQTLSRLNRAYNGPHGLKDTTYILDFANDPQDILAAFQTYYETAELAGVTNPNLIYDLRAKLDAAGHYDDFEVERVVQVELNPKATQAQLVAAIEPVADRLLKRFKAASAVFNAASAQSTVGELGPDGQAAKDEREALLLFKRDLGTFVRVYAFLSQMFDYGNTAIEKRAIFFKRLLPLLDFGKEREGVDLSKVVLTHHKLKHQGAQPLTLGENDGKYKLDPLTASGTGQIQDKEKLRLSEIVQKVNALFDGELTEHDMLAFVDTIKGKMMESELLVQQAMNNTKEQFSNSPDFSAEQLNAIIDAFDAFSSMSKQALDSEKVRQGIKHILLGPAALYESLRQRGDGQRRAPPDL
jgi:type I restriction enzyme, R subunit